MNDVALLKGFRDYLPKEAVPLKKLINNIETVFESFGFEPLQTPALEYAELLLGKYGTEGDKLMYRFIDHGQRRVALRYDHTVPLARVMALNQDFPLPFKRYTIAPVWRADKPQKGRLREFLQCDIDVVGSDQTRADAECLAVGYRLFTTLGLKKYGFRINHRKILDALAQQVGLAKTQINGVFHAIDKFPKYGEESFIKDLAKLGVSPKQTDQLLGLITLQGKPKKVLAQLKKDLVEINQGVAAIKELESIINHALDLGVPEKYLSIDLKIVRGLDYYTGMVVETILEDLPLYGSVFSGGRYDNLIGIFARKKIPAVGISLGLGRLFEALNELKLIPARNYVSDVLVALFEEKDKENKQVLKLAQDIRAAGLNVEIYLGHAGKIEKQLRYADKKSIPWVIWQGPEEKVKKVFAVKNLKTRKQEALSAAKVIKKITG